MTDLPPKRIGRILWRLERRWEKNPGYSLADLLRQIGGGSIPSDRVLMEKLRSEEEL